MFVLECSHAHSPSGDHPSFLGRDGTLSRFEPDTRKVSGIFYRGEMEEIQSSPSPGVVKRVCFATTRS